VGIKKEFTFVSYKNKETMKNQITKLMEVFGINALIGKEKGLSIQDIAIVNKEAAKASGFNDFKSEKIVEYWVSQCLELGVFAKNN
jgi:hypothetical protein